MAKKNFRGGMGNLLEESLQGLDLGNALPSEGPSATVPTLADYERLKVHCETLSRELRLWRQGLLDQASFESSLLENMLRYNPDTNQIEALE